MPTVVYVIVITWSRHFKMLAYYCIYLNRSNRLFIALLMIDTVEM